MARESTKARKEREAKEAAQAGAATSKALVLEGNLNEKRDRLIELRDQMGAAVKRRKSANSDVKAVLDEVETLGVSRVAFKHACKVIEDMTPEARENYDQSLALCRKSFGFALSGQGLLFDDDEAGGEGEQAAAGDGGDSAAGDEGDGEERIQRARERAGNTLQ